MEVEQTPVGIATVIDIGGTIAGLAAEVPTTVKTLRMSWKSGQWAKLDMNSGKDHIGKRGLPVHVQEHSNAGGIHITEKEVETTKVGKMNDLFRHRCQNHGDRPQ